MWAIRYHRIGTNDTPAGWRGFRGDGGNPGLIKLVPLNDISQKISYKDLARKSGSDDGKVGGLGEAGKHGRHGLDYVAIGK